MMLKFAGRVIILALAALLILSGCAGSPAVTPAPGSSGVAPTPDISGYTARTKQTNAYFSTTSTLSIYDNFNDPKRFNEFDAVWEDVKGILAEIENAASTAIETSDIARFNAAAYGESVAISAHTASIIKTAKKVYEETNGLFDPSVYPLVDLWGFSPRFNSLEYTPTLPYDRPRDGILKGLPDVKYIDAFVGLVDFGDVILSGDEKSGWTLTKNIPPVVVDGREYNAQIDLGGIAKGYAVDLVLEYLRGKGYEYGYFSCGTSSIALMKSASERARGNGTLNYNLGIRKPRSGKTGSGTYMTARIKDVTLSSSGDYDHSYELGGVLYCHIIDPRTGWPVNTPASGGQRGITTVTVLVGSSAENDALATALCVMGAEDAIKFANENMDGYKVVIVLYDSGYDYCEVVTNLSEGTYVIEDGAYKVASGIDAEGKIVYTGEFLR